MAENPATLTDCVLCDECCQSPADHHLVVIMSIGNKVKYTIPSFPVLSPVLREVRFQFADEVCCCDGYMRECSDLERLYPSMLKLCFGYANAFSIDREEFEQSIPLDNKVLYEDRVFIMWKWSWVDATDVHAAAGRNDGDNLKCVLETDTEDEVPNKDEFDSSLVTHSVTFKCMGVTKMSRSQEILAESAKLLKNGSSMELRLRLEPNNPKDARAIALDCKITGNLLVTLFGKL